MTENGIKLSVLMLLLNVSFVSLTAATRVLFRVVGLLSSVSRSIINADNILMLDREFSNFLYAFVLKFRMLVELSVTFSYCLHSIEIYSEALKKGSCSKSILILEFFYSI